MLPKEAAPIKPLRFSLNLDPDCEYLRQRGLASETVRRFGLGLCRKGLLADYVAIPVYGHPKAPNGNPIGYLGRRPDDGGDDDPERPRYKFPAGFPRNQVVYGLTEALDGTEDQPVIVVEGPFKVFHLFQAGFPSTVATFGASLSDEQAAILTGTGRPLVLMFDGDEAGQKGMRLAAGKLITRAFVRVIKLPPDVEPDALDRNELRRLIVE